MPHLDPFALPTGTSHRFYMLMTVVVLLVVNLSTMVLFWGERGVDDHFLQRALELTDELEYINGRLVDGSKRVIAQPLSVRDWSWLAGPVGGVLLLLLMVRWVYLRHPKRYQNKYPYHANSQSAARDKILTACRKFGVDPPTLKFTGSLGIEGQTFGRPPREVLLIHACAEQVDQQWETIYQPLVYHEIGHIANRDTHYREWARAFWKVLAVPSFVISLSLVMICLFLLIRNLIYGREGSLVIGNIALFGFQIIGMVVLMRLIWMDLIRTREWYADWWAKKCGVGTQLQKIISLSGGKPPWWEQKQWWFSLWEIYGNRSWWEPIWKFGDKCWLVFNRYWSLHPDANSRNKVLRQPRFLFKLRAELSTFTGLLFTACSFNFSSAAVLVWFSSGLMGNYIHGFTAPFIETLPLSVTGPLHLANTLLLRVIIPVLISSIPFLLVSMLIQGALGFQLQRFALVQLNDNRVEAGYGRLWKHAFLFVAGTEVGWLLTPAIWIPRPSQYWLAVLCWFVIAVVLTWLWLCFQLGLSRCLIGTYAGSKRPEKLRALITVLSNLLLIIFIWPLLCSRVFIWLNSVSMPDLSIKGIEMDELLFYTITATPFFLLIIAVFLFQLVVLLTLAGTALFLTTVQYRCPTCNEVLKWGFTVGQSCEICSQPLARWLYLPDDPELKN